jgi:coatomer subunit beta
MEVRRKAINIVLSMTSSRNVEDVVLFLKKQLQKTQEQDFEKVRTAMISHVLIATCVNVRHRSTDSFLFSQSMLLPSNSRKWLQASLGPSWNSWVIRTIPLPWTWLHLSGVNTITRCALWTRADVLFTREVVERFPHLRETICEKLLQTLGEIKSGKVFRGVLWILGEYIETAVDIQTSMREIRKVLGEIPILASEQRSLDEAGGVADEGGTEEGKEKVKTEGAGRPRVLADGTYATETAFTSTTAARLEAVKTAAKPPLRSKFTSRHVVHLVHCWQRSSSVATFSLGPC